MAYRKKLIEVALPLDAINAASAREKSIRHGHPSTLHLWWARRPLAACRAVLFAQLVDDPGSWPEKFETGEQQSAERERLHDLIRRLVPWEASNDEPILNEARFEIARSFAWNRGETPPARDDPKAVLDYLQTKVPPVYDPFCGGGSIPLEAQRLGLRAIGSDLNPVAVLITKALIEFPPKFAGMPPVNPQSCQRLAVGSWKGAMGLAEDVRYYGNWIRDEAEKRIGHLYPKARLPDGSDATVVAWLWARTVRSPDPAAKGAMVPLVSSFLLSPMEGKEAWVEVVVDAGAPDGYRFEVRTGRLNKDDEARLREGTVNRLGARCILTGAPIPLAAIRMEGKAKRLSTRLIAIVAEAKRGRTFLSPTFEHMERAVAGNIPWEPEGSLEAKALGFRVPEYGLTRWADLFTLRQLTALTTFSDLVCDARTKVEADATSAGGCRRAECDPASYADAVATYLAFLVSKLADKGSTLCTWDVGPQTNRTASGRSARVATVRVTFGRQALPMSWDFAEVNFFSESVGSIEAVLRTLTAPLAYLPLGVAPGTVEQIDVQSKIELNKAVISIDPPYYDNIGFADLSDFFYVWLRPMLKKIFPRQLDTLLVPKAEELVATPFRHGGREGAEQFFLLGMSRALTNIARAGVPDVPVTIYYAFKQAEIEREGVTSTGWATFLEAVLRAGFQVDGTWPIRTELGHRMRNLASNALASSIVLVCRRRLQTAPNVTRGEFLRVLKLELPDGIRVLQASAIAPVDLAQAAIGPGMAIFSRYAAVLESDDSVMPVKTALALINQELEAILVREDVDYDSYTHFAISWFDQNGYEKGKAGDADNLARAKNVGINAMRDIFTATGGIARLLTRDEMPENVGLSGDERITIWEATQQLVRRHEVEGVDGAASLMARLPSPVVGAARELAYRLFRICERRKAAQEALPYNALVADWPEIQKRKAAYATANLDHGPAQSRMLV